MTKMFFRNVKNKSIKPTRLDSDGFFCTQGSEKNNEILTW